MKSTWIALSVVCLFLFFVNHVHGDALPSTDPEHSVFEQRKALAASHQLRAPELSNSPHELENDLQRAPAFGASVRKVEYSGPAAMVSRLPLDWPFPSDDEKLALVMSTGDASSTEPFPGKQFRPEATGRDEAKLVLELQPEQSETFLSVTWQFFTTEFPRFSESGYSDNLEITVHDSSGHRSLVNISSDDPRVFPISESRAGGTGYDLYMQEKDALAANYKFGLPAAGMTDKRTTGFLIKGGSQVRLEITIRDDGDNILDSMAIIDRIELMSAIPPALNRGSGDCVNFQSFCSSLFPQPGSYLDPSTPERPPRYCEYQPSRASNSVDLRKPQEFRGGTTQTVIADGETRVPVGFFYGDPRDEVEISLLDANAPEDGGLGEFGSYDRLQSITVPTFEDDGRYVGLAQFRAPETYANSDLDLETEFGPTRDITVQFCFQNTGGTDRVCFFRDLRLRRPSALLMHGLWSSSRAWEDFNLRGIAALDDSADDYRTTNASSFDENRYIPQRRLFDFCNRNHANGWFATQADYIGHSMGGNLARVYLAEGAPYTTINRLYTLNTPHLGSPLANFVIGIRDQHPSPLVRILFPALMNRIGRPIDQGAIDDLAVGSDELAALPTTPVLSHALVGVGGTKFAGETLADAPGLLGDIYRAADFFTGPGDLFENLQHDLVVGRESQIGGLPLAAFTIFEGLDSIHIRVTSNEEYSNRILCPGNSSQTGASCDKGSGLATNPGTGNFSFFPAPDAVRAAPGKPKIEDETQIQSGIVNDGIVISSPVDGATFEPGDSVVVSVDSVAPFQAERVLLLSEFKVLEVATPPFEYTFDIPENFSGPFNASAVAQDSSGNFADAGTIELIVEPSTALTDLSISPRNIYLNGINDRRQLTVVGQYSDGIEREISELITGTSYISSDPTILSVSESGMLIPQNEGIVTILAQNDGLQDSITVEVLYINDEVFLDRFESPTQLLHTNTVRQ